MSTIVNYSNHLPKSNLALILPDLLPELLTAVDLGQVVRKR